MASVEEAVLSTDDVLKLFGQLHTAVEATTSSSTPLLTKARNSDPSLDFLSGLSLLLLRPHLLLSSLHQLVILLALRLTSSTADADPSSSTALTSPFASLSRARSVPDDAQDAMNELAGELVANQEVMEKVRGLESKLEYQIKKLVGLAEAEEARGKDVVEDVEEDPLSFRPNPSAIVSARESTKGDRPVYDDPEESGEAGPSSGVYRPPRVAAVPYGELGSSKGKRADRRAPALLSEFAQTMDGAPLLESTSGLATRPVGSSKHTNSISAKRAAELARINEFEEENMTRLVTSKAEAKRRRDDEEALAMGYGVGTAKSGRGRGRRQNGLDAELEGVLGDRGSRGVWDNVGKYGQRDSALDRGKKRTSGDSESKGKQKKARFSKELAKAGKRGRA